MNAFGAQLQNKAYKEGFETFAIFFIMARSTPVMATYGSRGSCLHCSTCSARQSKVLTGIVERDSLALTATPQGTEITR